MKYCSSCGTSVNEGVAFCPNCGAKMNVSEQQTATQSQTTNNNYSGRPMVENKSIATAIILSIVTCGIYGIIWYINLVNDVNKICNDDKSNQSGGTVFLLTLVTCGIYGIIWFYQAGKRMYEVGPKYGIQISDNSVIYLVLMLFGLGIVNFCLVQSDLNRFSAQ